MPEFIITAVALFFLWLFAVAGVQKLRAISWYAGLVGRYFDRGPAPQFVVYGAAAIELTCAGLLLSAPTRLIGLALACLLLLGYAGLMMRQIQRGRADMNCGCAGPASDTSISAGLVYRNLVCASVAAVAAHFVATPSLVAVLPWTIGMIATTGLLALFMMLIYLACEQLIANAQHYAGAF